MRRSKKTGYTSFDVFKEDLTEKTAALISKGYIPSYLGLREGQDVTKEDIRKIIDKKFTREKYEHQIKGVKERAVDMGRVEKNAKRILIDQYIYDVTYKQTKAISKIKLSIEIFIFFKMGIGRSNILHPVEREGSKLTIFNSFAKKIPTTMKQLYAIWVNRICFFIR